MRLISPTKNKICDIDKLHTTFYYAILLQLPMVTVAPTWATKHTKIAKKLEKHLEEAKPKVYTSYSNYMKKLHAKTS